MFTTLQYLESVAGKHEEFWSGLKGGVFDVLLPQTFHPIHM